MQARQDQPESNNAGEGRRTIVYLLPFVPSSRDVEVLGFGEFVSRGVAVEVAVLPVLPGSPKQGPSQVDGYSISYVRLTDSSMDDFFASRARDSLFIEYIFGLTPPNLNGASMYSAMRRQGVKYCVVWPGAIPSIPQVAGGAFARLAQTLGKILQPGRLTEYVLRRLARMVNPQMFVQPPPFRVFSGHVDKLGEYLARVGRDENIVTWINSADYDTYMKYLSERGGSAPDPESIAVFLDEGASAHRDFALLGASHGLSDAEYSASLRALFDRVEASTGLEVVIAAHPRADYGSRPGFFGDRRLLVGRTVDLVARSTLVIGHASTSLSFAVLFCKPLMLVKTPEMIGTHYEAAVDAFACELGLEPFSLTPAGEITPAHWDYARLPLEGYDRYRWRYIESPESPKDLTTWQIVAQELFRSHPLVTRDSGGTDA